MTILGIVLLAISAAMHAGWNLICKSRQPSGAFFLLATLTVTLLLTPIPLRFAAVLPRLPSAAWLLLVCSGLVQAIYYVALGNAYRTTDVSVAYPLARALPVIMIPAATTMLALGQPLNTCAATGMAIVAVGCIILPLPPLRTLQWSTYRQWRYALILLAACGTTTYTIIDSEALQMINSSRLTENKLETALLYIFLENLLILPFLTSYVMVNREERRRLRDIVGNSLRYPIISGITCTTAYTMVLGAMLLASNVSYVMAFRQLSIPLGATLGIVLLREPASMAKMTGIILICTGLAVVAFR